MLIRETPLAVHFPESPPHGYEWFDDEPAFDPDRHLALTEPEEVPFSGPGWAIAPHGDMVVHRAAPLTGPAERITMVNGYVSLDTDTDEQSRSRDLISVDDPECLYTERARFAAWRVRRQGPRPRRRLTR